MIDKDLEKDYDWRVAELGLLKRRFQSISAPEERRVILRCLTTLLYAHWEGFVKNALTLYIEFLHRTNTPRSDLKHGVIACSLASIFNKLSQQVLSVRSDFVRDYPSLLAAPVNFPSDTVNTKSNLKDQVLVELLEKLDLVLDNHFLPSKLVDSLVDKRNEVAHGQGTTISDLAAYEEYEQEILSLMTALAIRITEQAESGSYKIVKP